MLLKRTSAIAVLVTAAALPASAVAQYESRPDMGIPDTRGAAERKWVPPRQDLRMPDTYDAAERKDVHSAVQPIVRYVDAPSAQGFDWGDAGIGAAGGLAIVALAGGMSLVAAQRRRVHTP